MQKFLLLSFVFLNSLYSNAQNFEIKVVNNLNTPIQDCNIYTNNKLIGLTDSKGSFVLKNLNSKYHTLKFQHIGYKVQIIEMKFLKSYNEISLLDSNYMFKDFIVKSRKYKKLLIGNNSNKQNYMSYSIYYGGKIGSTIPVIYNKFYLNELNFYINDFNLPELNKKLKIRVCNCFENNLDTQLIEYFKPIEIVLNKKKTWYNIKLDTSNFELINTNCIFIEFEMMIKLTEKERLIKNRPNYEILFGQTIKSKNVTTFSENLPLDFDLGHHWGWHKTYPLTQKIFIKVTAFK